MIIRRIIFNLKPRRSRFHQVQSKMRRDTEGKLPTPFYGQGEILTSERWRRVVEKYNPKELLDTMDKLEEKARLKEAGVPIPRTFLIIETPDDVKRFEQWLVKWQDGFALKPSKGHGGSGVLVLEKRTAGRFIKPSGKGLDIPDLLRHAQRIISGEFSGEGPDRAIVEERLVLTRRLRELKTPGLLDIRIVLLKGFPLMAMTRLPTKRSGGRANIHQGAIGAGISISEGKIISATYLRRSIKRHPSSGRDLIGFRFNMWEDMLETASRASEAIGMGFVGVDLTVDDRHGVVVIEVNKRPGLEIQNANRSGLLRRIRWADRYIKKNKLDHSKLGPGIKVELSRMWDQQGWKRSKPPEGAAEE